MASSLFQNNIIFLCTKPSRRKCIKRTSVFSSSNIKYRFSPFLSNGPEFAFIPKPICWMWIQVPRWSRPPSARGSYRALRGAYLSETFIPPKKNIYASPSVHNPRISILNLSEIDLILIFYLKSICLWISLEGSITDPFYARSQMKSRGWFCFETWDILTCFCLFKYNCSPFCMRHPKFLGPFFACFVFLFRASENQIPASNICVYLWHEVAPPVPRVPPPHRHGVLSRLIKYAFFRMFECKCLP